jgi:hypothetical protein
MQTCLHSAAISRRKLATNAETVHIIVQQSTLAVQSCAAIYANTAKLHARNTNNAGPCDHNAAGHL